MAVQSVAVFWPADRAVTITETAEKIIVRMGDLLVEATRNPFHLRYCASDGEPFLDDSPPIFPMLRKPR
jgi:hypothetical protein